MTCMVRSQADCNQRFYAKQARILRGAKSAKRKLPRRIPNRRRYHGRMFQIANTWPRYRGRTQRILAVYRVFLEDPKEGLHPQQVARRAGMSMLAAVALLDGVPDLFVKLPKRDGLTRYRLNSRTTAAAPEDIEAFVRRAARREGWVFYASASMVLLAVLIVVLLMGWP